ncbi:MAG: nickel-responsive transcriptional regulator NikR [Elusimicrobiota bacterium]
MDKKRSPLRRFSVSVESDILKLVDDQVRQRIFPNRSDALRAMIRHQTTRREQQTQGDVIGIVGIVYDHHQRNLVSRMLHLQHDIPATILGSQHFHLDHHHCVETILLRGKAPDLDRFQKDLQNLRGIKHTSLSFLSPARNLK